MNSQEFNPYQPPAAHVDPSEEFVDATEFRPVPFEDLETEPRFWKRVWAMFGLLFRNPMELSDRVSVTSSLAAPWKFMMVLGIPVYLLWLGIMALFFLAGIMASFNHSSAGKAPAWLFALLPVVFLILFPLLQFVGMLVMGLVNHGCLWLWGGLRRGKEMNATIRACGYFFAFFSLVSWIPLVGSIALLMGPAALGIGLARIHRTETWRGVCAAYSPLLLCCCGYFIFFLIMIGVASSGIFGK